MIRRIIPQAIILHVVVFIAGCSGLAYNEFNIDGCVVYRRRSCISGTEGRFFVFGFLHNIPNAGPSKLYLLISNSNQNTVMVSVKSPFPGLEDIGPMEVPAAETIRIFLPEQLQAQHGQVSENPTGKQWRTKRKGIQIEASGSVSVVAVNEGACDQSSDAFTVFPVNHLGKEYKLLTDLENGTNGALIVATEDDTHVFVGSELRPRIIPHHLDVLSVFTLKDMSATKITCDKPVAVISGSMCGPGHYSGGCDHQAAMLIPISSWGYHFPVVTTEGNTMGDTALITLSGAALLKVTGSNPYERTQDINEVHHYTLEYNSSTMLHSDQPIQVHFQGQNNGHGGDPFLALVPAVTQFMSGFIRFKPPLTTSSKYKHYINIIIGKRDIGCIKLDGKKIARNQWIDLLGSEFKYTRQLVSSNSHSIGCTSDAKFTGMAYGYQEGNEEGYGFELGMDLPDNGQLYWGI